MTNMTYFVGYNKWYHFIFICVPNKFGNCNLCKSCDIIFLIYHVITSSKAMLPNGCTSFLPYQQIWFRWGFF